jgi:acetoin utilization deacetylase AcuC-like enzyme
LNDQAVAISWLKRNKIVQKILVVDLDVHQGNGTASIFQNDSDVFTLSFHGEHNYPLKKEVSSLDVCFPDGTGDDLYLDSLEAHLLSVVEKFEPEFVFYQSGVDILSSDKLGRLGMSHEGCARRDRLVLDMCKSRSLPVVCTMGGGYSPDIKDILNAHVNTYRIASEIFV